MHKHKGFTLIEVIMVLACMVGILSVILHFSMTLYHSWKVTAHTVQTRVALHAALDTLRRDLERASQESSLWHKKGPHEIIWHDTVSDKALRICVVKGRLERFEGLFDKRTQQWHTYSISVLAQDIQEIRCTLYTKTLSSANALYDSVAQNSVIQSALSIELHALNGMHESALIAIGVGAFT